MTFRITGLAPSLFQPLRALSTEALAARGVLRKRMDRPVPDRIELRDVAPGTDGMMVATDLVDGRVAAPAIEAIFADRAVATIHAHYAAPGCFAARIDRT